MWSGLNGGGTVVVATRNAGKVKEFAHRFGQLGLTVKSLADYEALPDIVEDGETFAANAEKKAATIARMLGLPVLADDSGLCVDALGGAPGVFSARYAGEPSDDGANNRKLLAELGRMRMAPGAAGASVGASAAATLAESGSGGESNCEAEDAAASAAMQEAPAGASALSAARFVCALALHDPATAATLHAEAACEGVIIDAPRGEHGFGYDPLFYVPAFGRTMAELTLDEKNAISHRGLAIERLLEKLQIEGAGR
ncbi:non-canonical purine NTP pyrophosphatase [Paenibacillus koleovorans]|uniref:non-canonical purine NTP pyrophosphatase n=1 Tax=Paenibacillus koleovorans TaxID=121608 RepID=UPI000FD8354B|nr:non-canonical purine NTP pyrophosphatase [Paenibacillus koleovorans]